MTWTQAPERTPFMARLIEWARENPDATVHLNANLPGVERLFSGEEGPLLALQQRWLTALTTNCDQAHHDGVPAEQIGAELPAADDKPDRCYQSPSHGCRSSTSPRRRAGALGQPARFPQITNYVTTAPSPRASNQPLLRNRPIKEAAQCL